MTKHLYIDFWLPFLQYTHIPVFNTMDVNQKKEESLKYRLKVCIFCNVFLLISVLVAVFLVADTQTNPYLRLGPNQGLNIMGISIHTWNRYFIFQFFLAFIQVTDVMVNEIVGPILGFNIYNPDKYEIVEFTRFELQIYANTNSMVNQLRSTLMVLVTISQIDIAILRVLYAEITTFYTIRILLRDKKFPKEDIYEKIPRDLEMV